VSAVLFDEPSPRVVTPIVDGDAHVQRRSLDCITQPGTARRRGALVLLGLLLVVASPRAVRAQTTEADFYVAQAAIDLDEKRYDAALDTDKNTLLPTYKPGTVHRFDREMVNVFRVELPLPKSLTLAAEVLMDDNASNIAVFDYKRTVNSLTLIWSY
jgi:hypothetical protein